VQVDGEEVDFMQYTLRINQIGFAFRVAALLGMIVVVVFSIIAILRTLAKENAEARLPRLQGRQLKALYPSFLFR
jgi:hypothetical protein